MNNPKEKQNIAGELGLTKDDCRLFHEGTATGIYSIIGAHQTVIGGSAGVRFALWAPAAQSVSLLCEANGWQTGQTLMEENADGIWEVFVPGMRQGDLYRFAVLGADGILRFKSDPYAFRSEPRPANASVVWGLHNYEWNDSAWQNERVTAEESLRRPMAIYEVHLGSWKHDWFAEKEGFLNYRRLADELSEYVNYMGFTHVELIGICEHPLDASWGYQVTGFYAPTGRYGSPEDFRYFVDKMHQCGIGVILDWVPAHFPKDDFALERFDGTALYEPGDPLLAEYPEWGTLAFDHGKGEVRSFLISNAFYWVREFHVDALRVDAVAAMLHTSFGRSQWRTNIHGGTENLESIAFLRQLNTLLGKKTGAYLIAEDSSIMSGVTKPAEEGGLGFGYKWSLGWMHDTLEYVGKDPVFRGWHHDQLTHASEYAFLENFVLVLSHDEVVHLKHSVVNKFPGNLADRLGGTKTLYTFMLTHPGKKLLFMGQEFAEEQEWDENREINWALADDPGHRDVMETLRRLLKLYRELPCLYSDSSNPVTFEWVNRGDAMRSTVSYIRRNPWNYEGAVLVICSFSPQYYEDYTCGVPAAGSYRRLFSTFDSLQDAEGTAPAEEKTVLFSEESRCDGYDHLIRYNLRPYESIILQIPGEETT